MNKNVIRISIFVGILFVIVLSTFLFNPKIKVVIKEHSIEISSFTYKSDILYDDIISVDIVEGIDIGQRENGLGLVRISVGDYHNKDFGNYRLYMKNNEERLIVVFTTKGYIVFNTSSEFVKIYEHLKIMANRIDFSPLE